MHSGHHFFLVIDVQVNEYVSATDKIHSGKRRVTQDIVMGKNTDITKRFRNAVLVFGFREKTLSSFRIPVGNLCSGIFAKAGNANGFRAQIGSKNLKRNVNFGFVPDFQ